jgi:hypothetical protein
MSMEPNTILHMIRQGGAVSDAFVVVASLLAGGVLLLSYGAFTRASRQRGARRVLAIAVVMVLSMASVIGVVWGPMSKQNFYYQGKIAGMMQDDAGVDVLYRAILSDGEFDTSERYRLVRYDQRGVEQGRLVLARADEGSLGDVWYVRLGDRLLFSASGEAQIIDLRTSAVELSYAQLIIKQPAFIKPIRRMAEDASGIWIEDHTGLRYKIDGATLEATRVSGPDALPRSPTTPLQGCLDHVALSFSMVKAAPQRQTITRAHTDQPGDGWIQPNFIQDHGQPCALQLVEGEQFMLVHDSLEGGGYRAVRVGGATQWDNALTPYWSVQNDRILFTARHDQQHLILVGESGRIGALSLESGQLAWSVERSQLARWWGDGVGVQVREAKLDDDILDLWVSEEDTTLHHVRRVASTGALITSVGF